MANNFKKGYVAISMVLILLVVTAGIASAELFLSTGNSKNFETRNFGEQALYSSEACLEEALKHLKNDPLYSGGEVSFPQGTCHNSIENNSGEYVLQVYFSYDKPYWRPIEAHVENVAGVFKIISWKEKNIDVK